MIPAITSASSNSPICAGSTLNLNSAATGTAPLTYSWTGTGTFSPNNASATPTVTGATTGNYTVTVTNACGSDNQAVAVVVNNPPTVANAGPDFTSCTATATMAGNTPGTGTGAWTFISGPSTPGITTPASATSGITGMTNAGTYTFQWTISNSPCTASSDQVVITRALPPTVTPGTYGPLCANAANINLGGTPAGGAWSGTGVSGSTFNPAVGTQTLTYSVNNGVCSNSGTTTITVNLAPGAVTVNTGTFTICQNGTVPGGQGLSASCPPIAQGTSTSFPGSNFISEGTTITTRATLTMPALPAGAVVTAARLKLNNVVANTGAFGFDGQRQNIRVALSGSYTLAEQQLTTTTGPGTVTPNPVVLSLASFPAAGGTINLRTRQTTDNFLTSPDATIGTALIEVDYTLATVVRWYNAPLSGTLVYSGSLFDPVGQSVVSNASASVTNFYATCGFNSCENARVSTTFTVNALANAGSNGTLTICSNAAAASLFNQLGGSPQGGGTWSGPSPVVGGNYNPPTMNRFGTRPALVRAAVNH